MNFVLEKQNWELKQFCGENVTPKSMPTFYGISIDGRLHRMDTIDVCYHLMLNKS